MRTPVKLCFVMLCFTLCVHGRIFGDAYDEDTPKGGAEVVPEEYPALAIPSYTSEESAKEGVASASGGPADMLVHDTCGPGDYRPEDGHSFVKEKINCADRGAETMQSHDIDASTVYRPENATPSYPSGGSVNTGGVTFANGGPENMQAYQVPGIGEPLPEDGKVPFMLINNVPSPQTPGPSAEQEEVNAATAALPTQSAISLQSILSSPQLMNVLCASILGPTYTYSTQQGFCETTSALS